MNLDDVTVNLYAPPGTDYQKTVDDARKRSVAGDVVLLHEHSARKYCKLAPAEGQRGFVDYATVEKAHRIFRNGVDEFV